MSSHNNSMGPVIGIDVATTYSVVSILRHGKAEVIANNQGNRSTPSVVSFSETERLVGDAAKNQAAMNPTNTIYEIKRLMGRKFSDPKVQEVIDRFPFKVIDRGDKPCVEVQFMGQTKVFTPEEITSMIIADLKKTAEEYLGVPVKQAVITVPAYFSEQARQATKDAAIIAGLSVLRLISEPTAATIAYGFDKKTDKEKTLMCLDAGGGTYDISVLTMENGVYEVKAVGGDACFDPSTRTLMANGSVREIKDINMGDIVAGDDGKPRTVLKKIYGKGQMYLVQQSKGMDYIVNGNHTLMLRATGVQPSVSLKSRTGGGRGYRLQYYKRCEDHPSFKKKEVGFSTEDDALDAKISLEAGEFDEGLVRDGDIFEMTVEEFLTCPSKDARRRLKGYKVAKPMVIEHDTKLPLDPYFLGLWLGDGDSDDVVITSADSEVVEYLTNFAAQQGLKLVERKFEAGTVSSTGIESKKEYSRYRLSLDVNDGTTNPILDALRELNVLNNKHIPDIYMQGSPTARRQLLAGLLDTDGCLYLGGGKTGTCYAFSQSEKRASMVVQAETLALTLGMRTSTIREVDYAPLGKDEFKDGKTVHTMYILKISGDAIKDIPCRISRKKVPLGTRFLNCLSSVLKVSPITEYQGQVRDSYIGIEVDGNQRYLLDDCTVVHNCLGGCDFDNNMVDHCKDEFRRTYGIDITDNARAIRRLRTACERAKRTLSTSQNAKIDVETLAEGKDFVYEISRARFESLSMPLFRKHIDLIEPVLRDAGVSKSQIDEIILVGGTTRIPKLRQLFSEFFGGKTLNTEQNPDEAIAIGAAIQAAVLSGDKSLQGVLVLDVTPLSIGIEAVGGVMVKIIERNSTIPLEKSQTFSTQADNQTTVDIKIFEGERPLTKDCNRLGHFVVSGLPPAPRGTLQIEISMNMDADSILVVSAIEKSSGKTGNIKITNDTNRLSKEQVERMIEDAKKFKTQDEESLCKTTAINKLESLIYSSRSCLKDSKISSSGKEKITRKCDDVESWLGSHQDEKASAYEAKFQELETVVHSSGGDDNSQEDDSTSSGPTVEELD